MDDSFGWRAKVGILLPSVNTIIEPWFYHVAPSGVTFHFARMGLGEGKGLDSIKNMAADSLAGARLLADIPLDLIAYCCTASTLVMGPDYDSELISKLEAETGIPCTTTTISILRAFEELNVRKLSLISPYSKEIEELEVKYFTECGFEVLSAKGMNLGMHELDRPSPEEIYHFAKKGFDKKAECLLISCLNYRAQSCIHALEKDLTRPVVSSAQAVIWNILRTVGVNEMIDGFGRLLNPGLVH